MRSVGLKSAQDGKYIEVVISSKFPWLRHARRISNHANTRDNSYNEIS